MNVKVGIYHHYKGGKYRVVSVAKHSETLEDMVVYEPLYENAAAKLWERPLTMFLENVEVDGKSVPRFRYLASHLNKA
jgi:hypothetical protein